MNEDLMMSRRRALMLGSAGALIGAAGSLSACARMPQGRSAGGVTIDQARGSTRLVHFTDPHIRPEFNAVKGVDAALAHVQANAGDADMLIGGGDMIMHAMDQELARTRELWSLWTRAVKNGCAMPVEYCIGNHDIWGWNKEKSKSAGTEATWGKKWWSEITGRATTYKAIDRGLWRIVILDSVQPLGASYQGRLDEEQFAWLENQLTTAGAGRHVLVISHIPILCISMIDCDARLYPNAEGEGRMGLVLGSGAMHMDAHRLLRLFQRVGNVRACLSGHIHTVDHMNYLGIDWFCNGAVCGMWWRDFAANMEFMKKRFREGDVPLEHRPARADPGYAVVDLFDDGRVARKYVTFGWTPASGG
ncbi:MAG: metallophosphoesterase [Phycisphaerales bacterium]|nr:metallophosphoesterase [Phycisphaerales bacterium]